MKDDEYKERRKKREHYFLHEVRIKSKMWPGHRKRRKREESLKLRCLVGKVCFLQQQLFIENQNEKNVFASTSVSERKH